MAIRKQAPIIDRVAQIKLEYETLRKEIEAAKAWELRLLIGGLAGLPAVFEWVRKAQQDDSTSILIVEPLQPTGRGAALTLLTAGCASNTTSRKIVVPGGELTETMENPKTWSVNAAVGTCWRITWKQGAEVVKTECGNGPKAGDAPESFTHSDFAIIDCSECEGADLEGEEWPIGGFPYVIGTSPEDWTVSNPEPLVLVMTAATSYAGALAKLHTVAQNGPGSVLPGATEVEAYLTISVGASGVILHSALAQRFASYTITLNGQLIANKATGLNAVPTALPEGWVSVASAIPSLPSGSTIVLTQCRQGSTREISTTLTF